MASTFKKANTHITHSPAGTSRLPSAVRMEWSGTLSGMPSHVSINLCRICPWDPGRTRAKLARDSPLSRRKRASAIASDSASSAAA